MGSRPGKKTLNTRTLLACLLLGLLTGGLVFSLCIFFPTLETTLDLAAQTPTPVPPYPDSVLVVTPDPFAVTPEPMLSTGSQGSRVREVQTRLRALGYYSGEIDGQFGPGTRDAVRFFQQVNGLDPDGIVGAMTMDRLNAEDALRAPAITPVADTPVAESAPTPDTGG